MKTTKQTSDNETNSFKKKESDDQAKASPKGNELATKLGKLFEDELKDIYWAEKALTEAIPMMIENATSEELADGLEQHLEETKEHVVRAERVFELIGKKAEPKKCEAMAGLLKEAKELMEEHEEGTMRDAAIISAAQKVEHYEIATYGTLVSFAQTLGLEEVEDLLTSTLEEEKAADELLTEVAVSAVNIEAASESESEE